MAAGRGSTEVGVGDGAPAAVASGSTYRAPASDVERRWPTWMPRSLARTLSHARFDRRELAGSLGDMGTFLPLLLGMVRENGLSIVSAMFFAGAFSVLTGLLFTIPMAVQPMKAIAAVAISEKLTVPQIMAAGAIVSAVVLLLGLTG